MSGQDGPVNGNGRVIPQQGAFMFRGVIVRAFINEFRLRAQHIKPMGKPGRYPEYFFVFRRQGHAGPFSEKRGRFPDIHGHVKHRAGHHPHQLALGLSDLVMQPPQNALPGFAVVVLDKPHRGNVFPEFILAEGFHEKTAVVSKDLGFDQNDIRYIQVCINHSRSRYISSKLSFFPYFSSCTAKSYFIAAPLLCYCLKLVWFLRNQV
jgi:hypothetical protein